MSTKNKVATMLAGLGLATSSGGAVNILKEIHNKIDITQSRLANKMDLIQRSLIADIDKLKNQSDSDIKGISNRVLIIETRNTPAKLSEVTIDVEKLITAKEVHARDINAIYEKNRRLSDKIDELQKEVTELRIALAEIRRKK